MHADEDHPGGARPLYARALHTAHLASSQTMVEPNDRCGGLSTLRGPFGWHRPGVGLCVNDRYTPFDFNGARGAGRPSRLTCGRRRYRPQAGAGTAPVTGPSISASAPAVVSRRVARRVHGTSCTGCPLRLRPGRKTARSQPRTKVSARFFRFSDCPGAACRRAGTPPACGMHNGRLFPRDPGKSGQSGVPKARSRGKPL